ncbi:MAG: lytic transglycosylase domain-containing protein [Magnetospirillum sp.]|nr:lytic transglycosylase domain-containing protein [Magnetospirillum sp.]
MCRHIPFAIVLVLLSVGGVAHAQASDKRPPAVMSESGRFARFVSEAALRFGIPTSWITAVMQAESRGVVRAISPKGAMGLMQIMPDTWSGLRSRYRLGADPFDPHDNILAGAAYLRELHDRYGAFGFLAAYNAGPGRYEDHLATGRPLPAETRAYVAALTPSLRDGGSAPGNFITAMIRPWIDAPLFPVRRSDGSTVPPQSSDGVSKQRATATSAADWTSLAPQSEGLFARLSVRRPKP